jgi:DNA ligase (NAD+)
MRYCVNPACPAQAYRTLTHFVSRGAMDIDGVGEQLCAVLMEHGLVRDAGDLYVLQKEQLLALDRMGDKSADRVLASIDASRSRPLSRVLFALGIRHVGSETAALLAQHFGSIEALIDAAPEEIEAIPSIGAVVAASVHEYFQRKTSRKLIERLRKGGVQMKAGKPPAREGPLKGQTFVITGTLSGMTRPDAESRIRSLGGQAAPSVTKATTYLVAGDSPGSKLAKAQKYGTEILSDADFAKLLKEHGAA